MLLFLPVDYSTKGKDESVDWDLPKFVRISCWVSRASGLGLRPCSPRRLKPLDPVLQRLSESSACRSAEQIGGDNRRHGRLMV